MDLSKAFKTDKRAESEGKKLVLVAARPTKGGLPAVQEEFLLIARKTNTNYKTYLQSLLQENRALLDTGTPEAEALAQLLMKQAASKHLLIGWGGPLEVDGPADAAGEPTKVPLGAYDHDKSLALMEMDDFYKLVDDYASSMSNYRAEEVAKDAKNSAST